MGADLIFVANITNIISGEKIVIYYSHCFVAKICHNLRAFMWRKNDKYEVWMADGVLPSASVDLSRWTDREKLSTQPPRSRLPR